MEDDEKKKTKEERQAERQAQREERQAERQDRRLTRLAKKPPVVNPDEVAIQKGGVPSPAPGSMSSFLKDMNDKKEERIKDRVKALGSWYERDGELPSGEEVTEELNDWENNPSLNDKDFGYAEGLAKGGKYYSDPSIGDYSPMYRSGSQDAYLDLLHAGYDPNKGYDNPEFAKAVDDDIYQRLIDYYKSEDRFPEQFEMYKRNAPTDTATDTATGVVSQGADSDLTPEQVVSKYGGDAERLKEAGFNPDGTPLSAETNLDEIDDKDLTPEQAVEKYKTKEELEAHGFNEDGTPLSVDDEDNDEIYQRLIEQYGDEEAFPDEYAKYKRNAPATGTEAGGGAGGTEGGEAGDEGTLPQPPAIPNAEDDETVKGIEQANATRDKAWSDYNRFYEDFLKQKEEYDRQRQERDSRNAFWRSIGEVGASLVNLLGVSGAFSGKNAYGRGAYSSMQKFDLTTPKLTEKMWADIDKRKERMDELKQKMMENKLKWQEVVAGGQEKGGTAKGAAADKQYTREYTQYKDQLSAQQAANQLEYLKGKAAADAVLAEIKMKNDKEIAKIRAKGRSGGGGGGSTKTPITLNLTYPTADGEKSFTSRYDVLEAAMKVNFGRLADCLARALGYNDYAGFSADKPTNYNYSGDNQIEKSLAEYFKTTKYVAMNNISNEKMTELLNWAYNALGLTQEGGELIENAVKAYAPIVDVMNAMNSGEGGGGGGDDTEDENEIPSITGATVLGYGNGN